MKEYSDMHGILTLQLSDTRGRVVLRARYPNHIVTAGRQLVAELFAGQILSPKPPSKVTHMAVGTDPTAPNDINEHLGAQRGDRKEISNVDISEITELGGKRVRARLTSIFDFADAVGPEPLREAGIFNAAAAGIMYNRVVFEPVTKTDAFKLTLIWDIVF
ncbi:hypothetical protein JXA70_01345 [candidate division KSB1 bacterium]|nr:hypothetical protein [candidate division KSB1 bacterium]